jgi:hypothetical protein
MIHELYFPASCALILLCIISNVRISVSRGIPMVFLLSRPSQIIILYISFSYAFGSFLFSQEQVLNVDYIQEAQHWTVFSCWLWIGTMLGAIYLTSFRVENIRYSTQRRRFSNAKAVLYATIAMIFMAFYVVTEGYLFFVLSLSFFLYFMATEKKIPIATYPILFVMMCLLFPVAAHSKRLLIFPIVIIILMRASQGKLSYKSVVTLMAVGIILIVPLSVMRGYGQFEISGPMDLWHASLQYVKSDYFLKAFGNNTEVNYFYFHGVNSVELFFANNLYAYGETIVKGFFLGLSRLGLDHGARSSIEIYTSVYAPNFRAIGGSYPINIASELFLNFWVFALLATPVFLKILDVVYFRLKRLHSRQFGLAASYLFLHATWLLGRGSSFDIFMLNIVYSIFSLLVVYLMSLPWKLGYRSHVMMQNSEINSLNSSSQVIAPSLQSALGRKNSL